MTRPLLRKWVWFIGLWIASVVALATVAMLIRTVIL
ncbi:DUF2474 domain-containing protein [Roseobacter denitrificans]|nr:DUF2474 domain-containing protein [Roseobacter denitrificans]SFF73195.1 Protein of unknown function [Roseobacter denitrificans OCh 114]